MKDQHVILRCEELGVGRSQVSGPVLLQKDKEPRHVAGKMGSVVSRGGSRRPHTSTVSGVQVVTSPEKNVGSVMREERKGPDSAVGESV